MTPSIFRPQSRLFSEPKKYLFTDALNTLSYITLVRLAQQVGAEEKIKCLAPECRSTNANLEWRKAMFVKCVTDLILAGVSLECIPDACSCEEFAQCICQEELVRAMDQAQEGVPGSSGLPNPIDCLFTSTFSAPGGPTNIVDTFGKFGAPGTEYTQQEWADLVAQCLQQKYTLVRSIPGNVRVVTIDFDALSAPAWVGPDQSLLISNEIFVNGDVPEISVNQINDEVLGSGRVWEFHLDGVTDLAASYELQLVFENEK